MADKFDAAVQRVIAAARSRDRGATASEISVGEACHRAVVLRVSQLIDAKAKRSARREALEIIAAKISEAGLRKSNLNRSIQIAQVSRIFGVKDAKQLPITTVASFARLIQRKAKDESWALNPKHEKQARSLWTRVVAGDLTPTAVVTEIDSLLGSTPRPPRAKPTPVDRLVSTLIDASADVITGALAALRDDEPETFQKVLSALRPLAPKAKRPEPPPTVETPVIDETKRKSLFGRAA